MAEHSDLYKEYNRIRKQINEQVRYYGLDKLNLPTAKGLKRQVQQTDIKVLQITRDMYMQPIKLQRRMEKIKKSEFKFNEEKKPKRKLSPMEAYKKYSSRFIGISQDGKIIDKVANKELGYIDIMSAEEIGEYIKSNYESTKYERPITGTEVEDVFELENFKLEIQARINDAARDMAYGQHGSQEGIDRIQAALNKFSKSDWEKAFAQYQNYVEEIRQALDQALYYSKSEEEHLRAIDIAVDLLSLNKTDINFSYDDYSENDYSDYQDYQYGRLYKYTKFQKEDIKQEPIYEEPINNNYKKYKAYVKDKSSGDVTEIVSEYSNKNDFIHDLQNNGYTVLYSALEENYDFDKWARNKEADLNNQPREGESEQDMLTRKLNNYNKRHRRR